MNLKEQLLNLKEILISFNQSGSMKKHMGSIDKKCKVIADNFEEEEIKEMYGKINGIRNKKNSLVAEKISNHFKDMRNISLDSKVDDFTLWYFKNMVKGCYTKIGEYSMPIDLRNFIEKMAVWYELRYPDYEINRLMNGSEWESTKINDVMFNTNKYINEELEEDSLVRLLDWDKFYNTHAFIKSLPWEERSFFQKPKYSSIVYLEYCLNCISPNLHLSSNGFVEMAEGLERYYISEEEVKGMHVKEVLKFLKEAEIQLPKDNELEREINIVEKRKYFKEELLNFVMYRIIERGGSRIGSRRAFLFAKEFDRNIDIPMMYGVDSSDPGLRNFIFEYLKAGGSKDLICYVNYFSKRNNLKNIETATIEEILKLRNNYTSEEKELHQRLINALNSRINHEELEKERVKQLRLERKIEKKLK